MNRFHLVSVLIVSCVFLSLVAFGSSSTLVSGQNVDLEDLEAPALTPTPQVVRIPPRSGIVEFRGQQPRRADLAAVAPEVLPGWGTNVRMNQDLPPQKQVPQNELSIAVNPNDALSPRSIGMRFALRT